MLWPFLGGQPESADGVPQRFIQFAHARLGQVLLGVPDGQSAAGDVDELFVASHKAIHAGNAPLDLGSTQANSDGLTKFMNLMVRSIIQRAPAEMTEKTNGGLVDTLLAGAHIARADRILKAGLLNTEVGCVTNNRISSGIKEELFAKTCPDLLFYTVADLNTAMQRAVASWTGEGGGDGNSAGMLGSPSSQKWFAPFAEQWQHFGSYLAEAAQWRRQLGDIHAEAKALPLFQAAQQAATWANALASGHLPPAPSGEEMSATLARLMGDDPVGLHAAGIGATGGTTRPSNSSSNQGMVDEG